jgi:predicted alpha/beta-hydrolase family hydrolase
MTARPVTIESGAGAVGGLLLRPPRATLLLVLAHGAGAGMRHPFLEGLARALAERGVATLRYQFPYMERGGRRPDPPAVAQATVRAALETARDMAPDLPIVAGGKSYGGRMTSEAAARDGLDGARGLVFVGFPLHAAGRPGNARAAHLDRIALPQLFVQGTRDALADFALMRQVCDRLGARATLHVVQDADHSFRVPKRSGRVEADVFREIAQVVARWGAGFAASVLHESPGRGSRRTRQ